MKKLRSYFPPMTNADRIRAMGDEELADFIQHIRTNTLLAEALGVPVSREKDLEFVRQPVKTMTAMDNTCVCCGAIIPEGRMVCPNCERGHSAGSFESRKPDECEGCIDLWGVHYCRWLGVPCVRVEECPEGRGDDDD